MKEKTTIAMSAMLTVICLAGIATGNIELSGTALGIIGGAFVVQK